MPSNESLLNPELLSESMMSHLNDLFSNAKPFRYVVVDNFLNVDLATKIEHDFPSIDLMKIKYKGINENKAEDSSFEKFAPSIQQLNAYIHSHELIEWITNITGFKNLSTINDRLGAGLHQGGNKSFLDIHIDYNIHPIKKKQRKLNLLIFFNKEWDENWGGMLELWNKTGCFTKILPAFNRMVLFECNEISYHGYSRISCLESITRKSYYHYFFKPITDGITFHDTIFLSKASDSFSKKILTKTKEFIKNKGKLIFYKIGLHKFLK